MTAKKFNCFIYCHLKHIIYILPKVSHIEDILLKPHSLAVFTGQFHVGHELHFNPDDSFSLALFASSAIYIEGEMRRFVIILDRCLLFRVKPADLIISFKVGYRIRPARLSDGVLVNKLYACQTWNIPGQFTELSWLQVISVNPVRQYIIKDVGNQARFSWPAYSGHCCDRVKGKFHIYILEIILPGTFYFNIAVPFSSAGRNPDGKSSWEIPCRKRRI